MLFFSVAAAAQTDLTVCLVDRFGRPIDARAEIVLTETSHPELVQRAVTERGEARFLRLPPGEYSISVGRNDLQSFAEKTVRIAASELVRREVVEVARKGVPSAPGAQSVSVAELKVPGKARKELDNGMSDLQAGDEAAAAAHFHQALHIYPEYAAAHNNLGVLAIRGGRRDEARSEFEASLRIDPAQRGAEQNLMRLDSMEHNWNEVEARSLRLVASDSRDVEALNFLAYAQNQLKKFASVIAVVHRLHGLPHGKYSTAHLVAARAAEAANDPAEAVAQMKLYLEETPAAPDAARVQGEIQRLSGL